MENTTRLFSKQEVLENLKVRYRLFNKAAKRANPGLKLTQGLTDDNLQTLGEIDLALPDSGPTRKIEIFSQSKYDLDQMFIGGGERVPVGI